MSPEPVVPVVMAFASILGLLGQFQTSRGSKDQAGFNELLQWLVDNNHKEIKSLIEGNTQTTVGIKALLKQSHGVLVQKLDALDAALSSFGSLIPGFSDISGGLYLEAYQISMQAKEILSQFEASGASKIFELHDSNGVELMYFDGNESVISISDNRFIEDDLKTLVDLGLLRHDRTKKGENIYIFTRVASDLVKSANL